MDYEIATNNTKVNSDNEYNKNNQNEKAPNSYRLSAIKKASSTKDDLDVTINVHKSLTNHQNLSFNHKETLKEEWERKFKKLAKGIFYIKSNNKRLEGMA